MQKTSHIVSILTIYYEQNHLKLTISLSPALIHTIYIQTFKQSTFVLDDIHCIQRFQKRQEMVT